MKMIIGGAFQGQLAWAKDYLKDHDWKIEEHEWIDGKSCGFEDPCHCRGIYDFHEYIRRCLKENHEFSGREVIERNPELVIVTNEIGYGLVPVDAFERKYREYTGRICTELAGASDLVVRVVMGIGTAIKGEL